MAFFFEKPSGLFFSVAVRNGKVSECTVPTRDLEDAKRRFNAIEKSYGTPNEDAQELADRAAYYLSVLGSSSSVSELSRVYEDSKSLPLDLQENVFWTALRNTRVGEVLTYSELASKAGTSERAARAAGTAMRKNPLPLLVPCHRVLRKSAGKKLELELGCYSGGGPSRKRELLEAEGVKMTLMKIKQKDEKKNKKKTTTKKQKRDEE